MTLYRVICVFVYLIELPPQTHLLATSHQAEKMNLPSTSSLLPENNGSIFYLYFDSFS